MKYATGYSPSHITSFFCIDDLAKNELEQGSRGAGFCLDVGVTTKIQESLEKSVKIYINNQLVENPVVTLEVLKYFKAEFNLEFLNIEIYHSITLPQGSGFGTSAAGALSLSFAINSYYNLNLEAVKLAQISHIAEIRAKTGLGTIAGEFLGGIEIRESAGAPGIGIHRNIQYPKTLSCHIFYKGKFLTQEALTNKTIRENVIIAGNKALSHSSKINDYQQIMELAHKFTYESKLLSESLSKLYFELKTEGIQSAMLMFGEGLYFLYPQEEYKKI